MIELLGQSPISSATSAGLSAFMSILRKPVSRAFGADSVGRTSRAYTRTRGIMVRKHQGNTLIMGQDPFYDNGALYFQFNPAVINDVKDTLYEIRNYAGLAYNDYVWGGGGERLVTFQLFLDNTPQSHTIQFRPEAYGSKLAHELDNKGTTLGFTQQGAWSSTRIHERGVLPQVEYIQSFLYPEPLGDEATPKFAEGGIVSGRQFRPPAMVVFALGQIYLEGFIKSAPVTYSLFDEDLTPIRATVDIELAVDETREVVDRKIVRFDNTQNTEQEV